MSPLSRSTMVTRTALAVPAFTAMMYAVGCSTAAPGDAAQGEAVTSCSGAPTACALLSPAECAMAEGCATGVCSGAALACSRASTSTACILQRGCSWDDAASACTGQREACAASSTSPSCQGASGCTWSDGCVGRAVACTALNETACAVQPGCHLAKALPGADDAAEAGSDAAIAPAAPTPCASPTIDPGDLIDDMEDVTAILSSSKHYGQWYVYNDATPGGHQTPAPADTISMEPIPGGRCESQSAMRITGTGFNEWGAGMGLNFDYGDTVPEGQIYPPPVPFDASRYRGVRFWARVGQAVTTHVRVSVSDKNTHPAGHVCTMEGGSPDAAAAVSTADCYNTFGKDLMMTTAWVEYRVPFTAMAQQPGWGYQVPGPTLDQLYALQFDVPAATTFDVWIDDLGWY